jgi:hypothetical protein
MIAKINRTGTFKKDAKREAKTYGLANLENSPKNTRRRTVFIIQNARGRALRAPTWL